MNSTRAYLRRRPQSPQAALAIGLLGLLAALSLRCGKPEVKAEPKTETPAYRTALVKKGRLQVLVHTQGRIVPAAQVEIKSKVAGTVQTVECELGSAVKKDQLLITLNPAAEARQVRSTEANLKLEEARKEKARQKAAQLELLFEQKKLEAEARVKSAERLVEDAQAAYPAKKDLFDKGQLTADELKAQEKAIADAQTALADERQNQQKLKEQQLDLELARKEIDLAEALVAQAQIALEEANARLNETNIYSPIDGVVTLKAVAPGAIVVSGLASAGGGTTMLEISDRSRLFLEASVDERDIGLLSISLSAKIQVTAFPGRDFSGRVVRIAPSGQNVEGAVRFPVRIEIEDEAKADLLPGMTGAAVFVAVEKTDVLLLPKEALIKRTAKNFVQLPAGDGKLLTREVTLGLSGEFNHEILAGLAPGETVILQNN